MTVDLSHVLEPPEKRVLAEDVAARLRAFPFVADAYTADELQDPGTPDREYLAAYRRTWHDGRSPDVMIRARPMYYITSNRGGTSHGTPYRYDSHVPLVVAGAGIVPGRYQDRVATADLAPTLARILGVPPGPHDGAVLTRALAPAP